MPWYRLVINRSERSVYANAHFDLRRDAGDGSVQYARGLGLQGVDAPALTGPFIDQAIANPIDDPGEPLGSAWMDARASQDSSISADVISADLLIEFGAHVGDATDPLITALFDTLILARFFVQFTVDRPTPVVWDFQRDIVNAPSVFDSYGSVTELYFSFLATDPGTEPVVASIRDFETAEDYEQTPHGTAVLQPGHEYQVLFVLSRSLRGDDQALTDLHVDPSEAFGGSFSLMIVPAPSAVVALVGLTAPVLLGRRRGRSKTTP